MEKIKTLIVKEQDTTGLGQTYNLGADAINIDYKKEDGTTQNLQEIIETLIEEQKTSQNIVYWN